MASDIEHTGTVVAVKAGMLTVRLDSGDGNGCAACALAFACGGVEGGIIKVPYREDVTVMVGRRVKLVAGGGLRRNAILLLIGIPLLLFLVVLVAVVSIGGSGVAASAYSLIAVVSWYVVLSFMRRRISGTFLWKVDDIS